MDANAPGARPGSLVPALPTPALLAWFPISPGTATALRAGAGGAAEQTLSAPALEQWITGLVPVNPIQAAAEGAMLPLVVFALVFGFALTRLAAEPRERLLGFFRALAEAMMVIVHWVLYLAPVGVFALVYPVGISAGVEVVGALGYYVLLVSGLCVVVTLAIYPATALGAGIPVRRFAAAAAPAQAVAFSTRSSLAALPVMIESAEARLGLPPALAALVLPLAVTLMRITAPLSIVVAAIFGAALYGIELTPAQIAAGAALSVVTSLGAVGLPTGRSESSGRTSGSVRVPSLPSFRAPSSTLVEKPCCPSALSCVHTRSRWRCCPVSCSPAAATTSRSLPRLSTAPCSARPPSSPVPPAW
jgi:proton glutamate symport protein